MKAAWFDKFGSASDVLRIGSKDDPQPAKNEVRVKLATSGVNPSDVKKRAGSFPNLLDGGFVIPHSDGAGVIDAVGEGIADSRIGERVWVYQAQYGRRFGTAAEYVTIDASRAVWLPEETSFEVGACLGIPAMTAHRCVFADGEVAGKNILVTGGAGRVGHYAIQWASQAGANVIATASSDADIAACKAAGATAVVNHRAPDWGNAVLTANGGEQVDRVVDVEFGKNLDEVMKCVRTGAVIATYSSTQVTQPTLPFFQMMYQDLTVRFVIVYAMPERAKSAAIEAIQKALQAGKLEHRVAHVVPLDEIARGHELIEQGGFRGTVVLSIP